MANKNPQCPLFLKKHEPLYSEIIKMDAYKTLEKQDFMNVIDYWAGHTRNTVDDIPTKQEWIMWYKESHNATTAAQSVDTTEQIKGINISSNSNDSLGKALTNPGNNISIEFRGKKFRNAEHAYQTWKSGSFDEKAYKDNSFKPRGSKSVNKDISFDLMIEILQEKLKQHPELLEEIKNRGGGLFLRDSTHNIIGDKFWESSGEDMFMNALRTAYRNIIRDLHADEIEESFINIQNGEQPVNKTTTNFSLSKAKDYPTRTRENASWSDITLALAENFTTAGERLTQRVAGNKYVSSQLIENVDEIANRIYNQIKAKGKLSNIKLNIAGNGIYSLRNDQEYYNNLVTQVLQKLIDRGVTIAEIRSGGQTGIDEAGIIAAQRLGIPNTVHTTSDYKFRDKSGKDISNENQFKARFQQQNIPAATPAIRKTENTNEAPVKSNIVVDQERLNAISQMQIRPAFKNATQRKDRVQLIARSFSKMADSLYEEYIDNLKEQANNGNVIAAKSLENYNRKQFIFEHLKEIIDEVEALFDKEEASEEALYELYSDIGYSDEDAFALAKQNHVKFDIEYNKVRENWLPLLSEATSIIRAMEGININIHNNEVDEIQENSQQEDPSGNNRDDDNNDGDGEFDYKEGWMIKARLLDQRDTLSTTVRKILYSLRKLDKDGNQQYDDLGQPRYLEVDVSHSILLNEMSKVDKPYKMMDKLNQMTNDFRWVESIIDEMTDKPEDDNDTKLQRRRTRALFWKDLKKEFNPYSIESYKDNPDGTITIRTKDINTTPDISFVINNWRDNIESGNILENELSIYNENEEPDLSEKRTNARNEFLERVRNAFSTFVPKTTSTKGKEFLANINNAEDVHRIIRSLGIEMPLADAIESLSKGKNLSNFLANVGTIYRELDQVPMMPNYEGDYIPGDIINHFNTKSKEIAGLLNYIPNYAVMQTFREAGKSYQSYTAPSYKGKVFNSIKNWDDNLDFIRENFENIDWFYDKKLGKYKNDWLEVLSKDKEAKKKFGWKTVLHSNRKEFNQWDDKDYLISMLTQFNSDEDAKWAWYALPLQADVESADYVRFYRYTNTQVYDKMVETVLQEYERRNIVLQRFEEYKKGNTNIKRIAWYDIEPNEKGEAKGVTYDEDGNIISRQDGAEFKFFPQLNTKKVVVQDTNGKDITKNFINALDDMFIDKLPMDDIREFIKNNLREVMKPQSAEAYRTAVTLGVFDKVNGKYKYFPKINNEEELKTMFYNFFLNQNHAYTQMVEILTTDLAFYKDPVDFQKRAKEYYAMTLKPYYELNDKYAGIVRNIIISDRHTQSNTVNEMQEVFDNLIEEGLLTKHEASEAKKNVKEMFDSTDGQALRTLKSFKRMLESTGDWTKELERAYNNLLNGTATKEDKMVVFQTVKPFVFSREIQDSHVGDIKISKPVQFKNSEALLFVLFGPQSQSMKLRALAKVVDKLDIDVIQFNSSCKVGNQGIIDYNVEFDSQEEYEKYLIESMMLQDEDRNPTDQENPEIIHSLSMDDWGIVAANPEHLVDAEATFGTQLRKLIIADMAMDTPLKIDGFEDVITLDEAIKVYSKLITAQCLNGLKDVYDEMMDINKLEYLLQKELNSNDRYDESLKEACTLIDDGQGGKMFNIPLYDPIQGMRIQQLINSIIKKRTVKHKIKGGTTTQVSSYGNDENINIRYLNKDGEFIFNEEEWNDSRKVRQDHKKLYKQKKSEFDTFAEYKAANKAASEAYWEAYMPAWDSKIIDVCSDENGNLDINRLPEKMRYAIITRIPTENKYSMQKIYIKDFLPNNVGSQLMLPADIVLITGADFDVDHNYLSAYDFDYKFSAKKAFESLSKNEQKRWRRDESLDKLTAAIFGDFEDESRAPWSRWINYLRDNDKDTYDRLVKNPNYFEFIEKKIDHSKSYFGQSKSAIDNAILDICSAILSSKAAAASMLTPQNFNENQRMTNLLDLAKNMTKEEFDKEIRPHMNDASFVKKAVSKYKERISPTDPLTQIMFHRNNSTGGKMVGIYANANVSHSLMQRTSLMLEKPVYINGKTYQSLNNIYATDSKGHRFLISSQLAAFLGASVDNVKNPTLAALNQNDFTTAVTILLLRLGITTETVALILNQPAILEATRRYLQNVDRGKSSTAIVDEVIKEYSQEKANLSNEEFIATKEMYNDDLLDNILIANGKKELSKEDKLKLNAKQVAILYEFKKLLKEADKLNTVTLAFRADTSNGSNGPAIADSIIRLDRVKTASNLNGKGLIGIPQATGLVIRENGTIDFKASYENLSDSELGFVAGFTAASLEGSEVIFNRYFPHYKNDIQSAYAELRKQVKEGVQLGKKIVNKFYEHIMLYAVQELDTLNTVNVKGQLKIGYEARKYFQEEFIKDFAKLKATKEELRENTFIKQLVTHFGNKRDPSFKIQFKNVGSLSQSQRTVMMMDWEALINSDDQKIQELGINLFRYCLYRQGMGFGPKSFVHLASPFVRQAFAGYIEKVREIMEVDNTEEYLKFVYQFIRNNLRNTQLCPVVSPQSNHKFSDDGKTPKEIVTISAAESSDDIDKTFIVKEGKSKNEATDAWEWYADPHAFISTKVNDKVVFYMLEKNYNIENNIITANYKKIDPLNGYEYEFGVDAAFMETVANEGEKKAYANTSTDSEEERFYEDQELTNNDSASIEGDYIQGEMVMEIHSGLDELKMRAKNSKNVAAYPAEAREDATGLYLCP